PLEGEDDPVLLGGRDPAEQVDRGHAGTERLFAQSSQLGSRQGAGDRNGELAAKMLRDPLVVPGQDLDGDAAAPEACQRRLDTRLGRVEEGREAGEDQLPLVADDGMAVVRRRLAPGYGEHAEAFGAESLEQRLGLRLRRRIEGPGLRLVRTLVTAR